MKKYKFTLNNYFSEDELNDMAPTIEDFVNEFSDDNGVATLNIKDDVQIKVARDEGFVLHMIINNDTYTALPKSLAKAKEFALVFIDKMKKALSTNDDSNDMEKAKKDLEDKAENDLLNYIGETKKTDVVPKDTTDVFVNGKEVKDANEKQEIIDMMKKKQQELDKKIDDMNKEFERTFTDAFADVRSFFSNLFK